MKKLALLAAVFGFAVAANAAAPAMPLGISAIGYDASLGHVTARLTLSENQAVDVGVGFSLNTTDETPVANDDNNFQMGLSGFYLMKLQDWGIVDNYLAVGGVFSKLPVADDNIQLTVFAGLQPEITLMDHLILSTRFGVQMDIIPNFILETAGEGISVVQGLNFKVIW